MKLELRLFHFESSFLGDQIQRKMALIRAFRTIRYTNLDAWFVHLSSPDLDASR